MKEAELVTRAAQKSGLTKKDVDVAIGAIFDSIKEEVLNGGNVTIVGFGTFKHSMSKEYKTITPQKKVVNVSARHLIKFRMSKTIVKEG